MNKNILIPMCLLPTVLFANKPAVEKLNYVISSNYTTSNIGKSIFIGGSIRIPVMNYIGIGLNTNLSSLNGKNNSSNADSKSAGLSLILRNSTIGKIEASYNYASSDNDLEYISLSSKSKQLNINATYYFNDFDFSLNRLQSKLTYDTYSASFSNGKLSSASKGATKNLTKYNTYINVAYYINNNLNISTRKKSNLSYKTNLSISYQADIFNNSIILFTNYDKNDKSYNFGLKYTFDLKVNLKDKIRKY